MLTDEQLRNAYEEADGNGILPGLRAVEAAVVQQRQSTIDEAIRILCGATGKGWPDETLLETAQAVAEAAAKHEAEVAVLREALQLLYREVVASGNAQARDFGWQKACEATRAALGKDAS